MAKVELYGPFLDDDTGEPIDVPVYLDTDSGEITYGELGWFDLNREPSEIYFENVSELVDKAVDNWSYKLIKDYSAGLSTITDIKAVMDAIKAKLRPMGVNYILKGESVDTEKLKQLVSDSGEDKAVRTILASHADLLWNSLFYVSEDGVAPSTELVKLRGTVTGSPPRDEVATKEQELITQVRTTVLDRYGASLTGTDEERWAKLTVQGTEYEGYASTLLDLLTKAKNEELWPELVNSLVSYSQDETKDWVVTAFYEMQGSFNESVLNKIKDQVDPKIADIESNEAVSVLKEQERERWAKIYLGRELTANELTVLKNEESLSDGSIIAFPELARAYEYFESGGVASNEANAEAAWNRFISNSDIDSSVRLELSDFGSLYAAYETFSKTAFERAQTSESLAGEVDPNDLVPYSAWTFEEWLNANAAYTAFRRGAILDSTAEVSAGLASLFEDRSLPVSTVAMLQQQPGESYSEYYARVISDLNIDEDFADLLISYGGMSASPDTLMSLAMPDAMAAIKREFLPRVAPEQREQFLNTLQTVGIPYVWSNFIQLRGSLLPGASPNEMSKYIDDFVDYAKQTNFFSEGLLEAFPSLQEQQATQQKRRKYVPTYKAPSLLEGIR